VWRHLTFVHSADDMPINCHAAAGAVLEPASSRARGAACLRMWELVRKELAARRSAALSRTLVDSRQPCGTTVIDIPVKVLAAVDYCRRRQGFRRLIVCWVCWWPWNNSTMWPFAGIRQPINDGIKRHLTADGFHFTCTACIEGLANMTFTIWHT
jgi:hypothetical protein